MSINSPRKRISYLIFRIFYTLYHLMMFYMVRFKFSDKKPDKNQAIVFVCGIEPENDYSINRLKWLIDHYQTDDKSYRFVLLSKTTKHVSQWNGYMMLPWEYQTRARCLGWPGKLFFKQVWADEQNIIDMAGDCVAMLDMGVKQLSSNVGTGWTANMLSNMVFAKKFAIPFHIFPQFMGPVNYPKPMHYIFKWMLKVILPSAASVAVRDAQSAAMATNYIGHAKCHLCLDVLFYPKQAVHAVPLKEVHDSTCTAIYYAFTQTTSHPSEDELLAFINSATTVQIDASNKILLPDFLDQNTPASNNVLYITNDYYFMLSVFMSGGLCIFIDADRQAKSVYELLGVMELVVATKEDLKRILPQLDTAAKLFAKANEIARKIDSFVDHHPLPLPIKHPL